MSPRQPSAPGASHHIRIIELQRTGFEQQLAKSAIYRVFNQRAKIAPLLDPPASDEMHEIARAALRAEYARKP